MLINCSHCGKCISTKKPGCVYCRKEIAGVEFLPVKQGPQSFFTPWRERLKGGILSIVIR